MSSHPMVEIRGLTKSYGQHNAITNLNFSIRKGEVVGFLGPNGAGKSTTMKIVTGYMAPSSGDVRVGGFDVYEHPVEVKKRIGYLPETPPLYSDMFVRDYLIFVARLKGVETNKLSSYVDLSIEKAGLKEVQKRLIHNLSKGYKQRVGIAQALVSQPELLILDEPTVGLDPKQVAEIRSLIAELKGHHTIVLSTHILPEVQATCERIIIIHKGHIVAEDTLDGLNRRMQGSNRVIVKVRRNQDSLKASLQSVKGVLGVGVRGTELHVDTAGGEDVSEELANRVVQSGAGLVEMRSSSLNLEDIFLKLTSDDRKGALS